MCKCQNGIQFNASLWLFVFWIFEKKKIKNKIWNLTNWMALSWWWWWWHENPNHNYKIVWNMFFCCCCCMRPFKNAEKLIENYPARKRIHSINKYVYCNNDRTNGLAYQPTKQNTNPIFIFIIISFCSFSSKYFYYCVFKR